MINLERLRSVAVGAALALSCLFIQNGSELLASYVAIPVSTVQTSGTAWGIDLSGLKPGAYYLSLGRPKGICDLLWKDTVFDSNRSALAGLRQRLPVGASFLLNEGERGQFLRIRCELSSGFKVEFTHRPVVAHYRAGILVQALRVFTSTLLGPLVSLLLLATVVLRARKDTAAARPLSFAMFAVVAFLYTSSLAHWPRLVLSGGLASLLHSSLRVLFSLAFVTVTGSYSKHRPLLWVTHFAVSVGLAAVFLYDPSRLDDVYRLAYIVFPVATLVAVLDLFRTKDFREPMNALRALSILWLVSQVWDTAWVWTASGTPQTPSALLLISVSMIYMSYRERVRSERLESASARVLSLIEGNTPIRDLVTQVGRIVAGETEFPRVSAYIDAFCVGAHDHPHQVFLRVLDQGYKKDTQKDSVITFGEGRGMFMAQALETQSCVMRQGKQDKAWFISMAIGKHACLNLSHDSPSSSEQAFARLETLERLRPALQTLDRRLVAAGLEQSSTLQRLRSVRGDGSWEIEAGSIFVDINNYSKFSETFGLRFTGFVSNTYFPALVKAVSALALPEHVVGDEAHLLIVPDILPVEMDVAKGVVKSLSEIDRFVREAGAHLCENNGFDQLTLSIGVNVGRVTLVCDGIRVRTAGQVINEAKRLQDEAGKAGILVHGAVRLPISDSAYREGETFPILVKKNLITATRLLRYQKPDSSAA